MIYEKRQIYRGTGQSLREAYRYARHVLCQYVRMHERRNNSLIRKVDSESASYSSKTKSNDGFM